MARTAGDRLRARFETARWRRTHIADVLASPVLTRSARGAIARHEWGAVNEALFHLADPQPLPLPQVQSPVSGFLVALLPVRRFLPLRHTHPD